MTLARISVISRYSIPPTHLHILRIHAGAIWGHKDIVDIYMHESIQTEVVVDGEEAV